MKKTKEQRSMRGTTLLETLIYIALLGVVGSLVAVSSQQALSLYSYTRNRAGITEQARHAVFFMKREIANASSVYTPTSVFGANPGQLSVETSSHVPDDETTTFVDFYIDDDRLFVKREGTDPELLVSEQFRVPRFIVTHLHTTGTSSALRIELSLTHASQEAELRFGSTTIITTATLRTY